MIPLISLRILLGISLITAYESPPSEQPEPTFRIYADLNHTGSLTGPLTSLSPAPNDFGIAVPIPARTADRDRWPEKLDAADRMVERLGRLRIETAPAQGDIRVAIESESRSCLRLFRNANGAWRRLAPSEDSSWTLAPGKDGTLEIGVGVVMPEVRPTEAQVPWPRTFTVEISSKPKTSQVLRVPFRVAPFVIPSALEPVEELLIVSQAVTTDSVRSVRAFAARTGIKLVVHEVDEMCDQWMQDTIEPGLFAFPTAEGSDQAAPA